MAYFAGLDVSVKETSVCIVDDAGKIVREVRVASEPEALLQVLTNTIYSFNASWAGSWTAVAVALQCSRRSRLAGDLR
jgi:predicted NBD/HSP70 family sugar kinase